MKQIRFKQGFAVDGWGIRLFYPIENKYYEFARGQGRFNIQDHAADFFLLNHPDKFEIVSGVAPEAKTVLPAKTIYVDRVKYIEKKQRFEKLIPKKPVSQMSKDELLDYATILGLDVKYTMTVKKLREIINTFVEVHLP